MQNMYFEVTYKRGDVDGDRSSERKGRLRRVAWVRRNGPVAVVDIGVSKPLPRLVTQ